MGMLEGKSIAVTGAGRGIGRAVALACAKAGAKVVVNDYGVSMDGSEPTSEPANEVVEEIKAAGGEAVANPSSVAEMAGGESIVQQAVDTFGSIDGVVCVAGILREKMLFNMAEEDWDPVIETHLKGHFTLFRAASAVMRKQKSGSLVGFTSGAFAGSVAQANYASAKGGIVSLVRSAAAGLNKYGVRANCIAPTAKTRMSENVPFAIPDMGSAEDIAPMAVYAGASQLPDASSDEDDLLPVVAELSYDIEVLTVEQAVMRLELGGSSMLMFRNASHFGLNVVYLRDDGSIGWIDPRGARHLANRT